MRRTNTPTMRTPLTTRLVLGLLLLAGSPALAQEDVAPPSSQTPASQTPTAKPKISLADFEDAFLEVAEHVRAGVVAIEVRIDQDP